MGPTSRAAGCKPSGRLTVIGLGSNRPGRAGRPAAMVEAAARALEAGGLEVLARTPAVSTRPLAGMAGRAYANAALLGRWSGSPEALLALCKGVERGLGRRGGRHWGPRAIDCDLWLMDGVARRARPAARLPLALPHPGLGRRTFALAQLHALWPGWRWPGTALAARHLRARRARPRPVAPDTPPA